MTSTSITVAGAAGPVEVLAAARAAGDALVPALSPGEVVGSRAEWADALGELQRVIDVASAAQDAVVVRLAGIEPVCLEDGTVVESHRALGHAALDAPSIVSGVLNVSAVHAERRVRQALRWAADGPEGTGTSTGLGGLHAAMGAGRLDEYRASVIARELEEAPAEVAASVVGALEGCFGVEDGPTLRRRCRRVLARVSPDLLRQRAVRARAESSLRRWVDEPGVDTWLGTFPSEDAAQAWAAIDALAQRYVNDGVCERIDRARAKALTDLVAGNATIDVHVTLTTPMLGTTGTRVAPATPATAERARLGPGSTPRRSASTVAPADSENAPVHVGTAPVRHAGTVAPEVPKNRTLSPLVANAPGDLVEVSGLHPGDPVLVQRGWLQQAIADTETSGRDGRGRAAAAPRPSRNDQEDPGDPGHPGDQGDRRDPKDRRNRRDRERADRGPGNPAVCDPATGALLDPNNELATHAYRPGSRLAALVRDRDGRCRFPGCRVAARFCDLDHVRPWPTGPTTATNLICLCRRHHRTKQRPGWTVRLDPDGTVAWTDPTRRRRTTQPIDHLSHVTLPEGRTSTGTGTGATTTPGTPRLVLPDGPHSTVEFAVEHHLAGHWTGPGCRVDRRERGSGLFADAIHVPGHHEEPVRPGDRRRRRGTRDGPDTPRSADSPPF